MDAEQEEPTVRDYISMLLSIAFLLSIIFALPVMLIIVCWPMLVAGIAFYLFIRYV